MVRLEGHHGCSRHRAKISFNSSMVRLEGLSMSSSSSSCSVSIPVWYDWKNSTSRFTTCITPFQFQYGTIGSHGAPAPPAGTMSFNSSMVRLKVKTRSGAPVWVACFNSSMVRLKAGIPQIIDIPEGCFNSSMVRLEVTGRTRSRSSSRVSIPVWYDWKYERNATER